MIKIRKGVFETNSSSMHSLTIDNSVIDKVVDNNDILITLGQGEYGWGYETLKYWEDKADYFGIEAYNSTTKKEMLEEAIKIKFPNCTINWEDDGYIDHQSYGDIWNQIDSVETLYNILFSNSKIIIDNDNH